MRLKNNQFMPFASNFFRYAFYLRHVLLGLILLLAIGGFVVSQLEGLELGEGIYFAFITGLTVGYGDISPETHAGRVVSVLIAMIGVIFTGVTVAIATRALADAVRDEQKTE